MLLITLQFTLQHLTLLVGRQKRTLHNIGEEKQNL